MTIYAIVETLRAGYDLEKKQMVDKGFKVGDRFVLSDVDMGQSSTSISLEGQTGYFNSVFFKFEENGEELDIYGDSRFNPYMSMYDDCD